MDTRIYRVKEDEKQQDEIFSIAKEILKNGGLVAFPTETVYGLGANALDAKASQKVYAAKGRPSDNPLIVHIADNDDLYKLCSEVGEKALLLAEKFWPGPLTMILHKKNVVPDQITGGLDTVAIRMPSHPTARKLIKKSGMYIAAPSANISGRPSPTKADHVIEDLNGKIDMIIADDTVEIGIESTIVDLTDTVPTILRPGFITKEMLEEVLGEVLMDKGILGGQNQTVVPKAPGMKYKHYAPQGDLSIVEGLPLDVIHSIISLAEKKIAEGYKVGIMATEESFDRYSIGEVRKVGSRKDEATVAKHLYEVLREFDDLGVDFIYSEGFSEHQVGQAVMNRLIKAAGHKVIYV